MEKFSTVSSRVTPLKMRDIDTDMIIPAQYLTSIKRDGFGANLFRRLRDSDSEFPLNRECYQGSSILLVGDNFGCGSSREHAVWALLGAGIKVIIGSSFADIFSGNAAKNGLLLVKLGSDDIAKLFQMTEQSLVSLSVDLKQQKVYGPENFCADFEYDAFRKYCLLEGQDDLDYLISHKNEIGKFFAGLSQK